MRCSILIPHPAPTPPSHPCLLTPPHACARARTYSAILIHTAALAYARPPAFDVYAPHQPSTAARVAWALRHVPAAREACIAEGMDPDGTASVWEPDGLREASKKRSARKWAKL